ncbi:spore germination protein GerPB [Paenibacillus sp. G2S3]|uniref:spore germination protein GerPB n=1 Tax=Paenibacillus sp. G2S3 TaxID=3047872 RepID=UPI0024C1F263|nr:spore germination protein GerPB [Paenibacillus sp. G2S3]WHY17029.1 spore germination protein GerPB [Paenibacillus sp. G2S3]
MNITVYQCISVNHLKIGTISNSSVLQIGTSGRINALSHSYQSSDVPDFPSAPSSGISESPLVLLPPPTELYTR